MLEHYHKSEHSFVRKVIDHKKRLEESNENLLTNYLSPREVEIYKEIFGKNQNMIVEGGYKNCERNKVFIQNNKNKKVDLNISAIKIEYNKRFGKLNHKNIFGALMRLGLGREMFGDLYIGKEIYIFVNKDKVDYIIESIDKIAKNKVLLLEVDYTTLDIEYEEKFQERMYFLKSYRLDLLVAHVCIYPRSEAQSMIKKGLIKVNHKIIEKDTFEVKPGDIVSVRGYGRMKLLEEHGITRNERIRITIGKVL